MNAEENCRQFQLGSYVPLHNNINLECAIIQVHPVSQNYNISAVKIEGENAEQKKAAKDRNRLLPDSKAPRWLVTRVTGYSHLCV